MKHVIVTRMDYPLDFPQLAERIRMFYQYTVPSVLAQTKKKFTWVILSELKLEIPKEIRSIVKKHWKPSEPMIVSRLDSDDIILPNYVELVQSNIEEGKALDLSGYRADLRNGLILYEDKIYRTDFASPFYSLITQKNIYRIISHARIHTLFPVKRIETRAWVQIIHRNNKEMSNMECEKRGRPIWKSM
jgi:hypothetical protein